MDDNRRNHPSGRSFDRPQADGDSSHAGAVHRAERCVRRLSIVAITGILVWSQAGCSLFVMAGKAVFGETKVRCSFRQVTDINLPKSDQRVLILCSTPESIKIEEPSLDFDLLDKIARRLKVRGVNVVSPDLVTTWLDDHGGRWDDPAELGEEFDADIIIHIDLDRFSYQEENSPSLLRARVDGRVHAYEVLRDGDVVRVASIFDQEFVSVYPDHHPVSIQRKSPAIFKQEYLTRLTIQLSQLFYDHPIREEIH